MSKKKKTNYLNLDKNQLVDKGKSKLQYEESCKESAKRYSESKKHENSCKTSKGTVKNISKKLLIDSIVFILSTTSLTGCKAYGFDYNKNNDGIRYATGTVDNNYMKDCYYIQIYNPKFENIESYITVKQNEDGKIKYLDVFTLDTIYIENDEAIDVVNIICVDEYLTKNGIEKSEYNVEDMEEILEKMGEESPNKTKKLVK